MGGFVRQPTPGDGIQTHSHDDDDDVDDDDRCPQR